MPALRGQVTTPGAFVGGRSSLSAGEVWVTCDRHGCTWRTVRPEGRPAWSAGEAHRIAHAKGWV